MPTQLYLNPRRVDATVSNRNGKAVCDSTCQYHVNLFSLDTGLSNDAGIYDVSANDLTCSVGTGNGNNVT